MNPVSEDAARPTAAVWLHPPLFSSLAIPHELPLVNFVSRSAFCHTNEQVSGRAASGTCSCAHASINRGYVNDGDDNNGADNDRTADYSPEQPEDCPPPPSYDDLFAGAVAPVDTSVPLRPSRPDGSASRRRSLSADESTLKSRPSIDEMIADPRVVIQYPSLRQLTAESSDASSRIFRPSRWCPGGMVELAFWTFIVCTLVSSITGLVFYIISEF